MHSKDFRKGLNQYLKAFEYSAASTGNVSLKKSVHVRLFFTLVCCLSHVIKVSVMFKTRAAVFYRDLKAEWF